MNFKQLIRLISMGLILVLVTSMIVLVLPKDYISQTRNSPAKGFELDMSSVIDNLKGLVKIKDAGGKNIDVNFGPILRDITKALTPTSTENGTDDVQTMTLDTLSFDTTAYYSSAAGKTGDELKKALNDIIDKHVELSYKEVWDALKEIDEDPTNPDNVILIYTGKSISKDSNGTGRDDWNREHVWAKSHGDFGTSKGAGTDLHHIRPADVTVNSSRNNKNFDNSDAPHHEALLCRHDEDSFEPRDAVKGDVARMMFYMVVRYEGEHGEPDLELVEYMNESKSPYHGKLTTLMEWHEEDPVSDIEKRRNNLIYEKFQGNRNPFIDHPEWVDYIWDKAS